MRKDSFIYELPQDRIALYPAEPRDECKLIVIHRETGKIEHRIFKEIYQYLYPEDCIVLNNSKVHPVRIRLMRKTGGVVELLLSERLSETHWISLARPAKRLRVNEKLVTDGGEEVVEIEDVREGKLSLKLLWSESEFFSKLGMAPLPGYIQRVPEKKDIKTYQAVYAKQGFSIAAPTAGLHFTKELLKKIKTKGTEVAYIQLDVGEGTFRPIKSDMVEDHHMLSEKYSISNKAAEKINRAKRIIAVGTTVTRTLESFKRGEAIADESASTDLFIYPGYKFKRIGALLTNFHQPASTPLLLTSAFCGKDLLFTAYKEALDRDYRFLSYGDAMLIL